MSCLIAVANIKPDNTDDLYIKMIIADSFDLIAVTQ